LYSFSYAQETTVTTTEQQLENLTDNEQAETEDDSFLQQLEFYRKNPMNLNVADEYELKELKILSGLQISSLITYRKLFGNFISIYELQAIPAWDVSTIKKLLPFITVSRAVSVSEDLLLHGPFTQCFQCGHIVL
jgi:DNA uptake protein ComE-like DNA-binding protein